MAVNEKVRKAAVAGQFYPSSPRNLRIDVDNYLNAEKTDASAQTVSVMIAPHAGYVFSAPVAAKVYARIPRGTKTVFLIGPSHHKLFEGMHVTDADYYETPLGRVKVNRDIADRLLKHPLCGCEYGVDDREHCLEVHIPFLQALLGDFAIVPILTGKVEPADAAEMLLPFLDDTAVIIASSDLSHFFDQTRAREADDATVLTILSGDTDGFMDGCGETAMRVVMHIAADGGLVPELLDARTSFETSPQHCDSKRVVGYAAVAFNKSGGING
ncbi:MAG: AmmeMemoRadiSam system protein B [Chitinispirillia bacterium]|nr:AmmeMemoRadiSam system protein B [Chitinispirillia bacterium]MCL2268203.1 AmmeMemoRadiSam system protein B [Chitinispirillia bacterium]